MTQNGRLRHTDVLYTGVNSPGYFAQRKEWPMVWMFGVLLALVLASLALVV